MKEIIRHHLDQQHYQLVKAKDIGMPLIDIARIEAKIEILGELL